MKILIITTVRFRFNGITSVILNYYRNMDKTDMTIDIAVPNEISDEYREEFISNGSEVYFLNRKGNPLKYFSSLYKLLKNEKYDIVHIHGNSSMMLLDVLPSLLTKVPVRIVHSHNTTCNHIFLHKLLNPVFRRCYTHGFACGQDAGKWLFGKKDFIELKNGIETKKYMFSQPLRDEYRAKLKAGNKTVIGHVGNFIEQKNHVFLINMFADLLKKNPEYILLLISDGELMEQIKAQAESLGISESIIFLGKTPDVCKYMQAMDIFVLPSLYEGLPVVLVEAQSAGLPCLVSDKVAVEANLTGTIKYIGIDNTAEWVNQIESLNKILPETDRKKCCEDNNIRIADSGYDITKSAELLRDYYTKFLKG
ncbi:MAG: glycosyltransferase family 1 protein [Ruminococcus sp.]